MSGTAVLMGGPFTAPPMPFGVVLLLLFTKQ